LGEIAKGRYKKTPERRKGVLLPRSRQGEAPKNLFLLGKKASGPTRGPEEIPHLRERGRSFKEDDRKMRGVKVERE